MFPIPYSMIIVYWSDFSCPYCYIAETSLEKAVDELGISDICRLVFKSFRLNPMAKKVPEHQIFESYAKRMGVEGATMQMVRIESMAASLGLDFHYGTAWNSNTFDAHRLAKYAYSIGRRQGDALVKRFYDAFFRDNLVLADHEVLLKLCEECGLDSAECSGVLSTDLFADDVLKDEAEAHSYGINAVPFFIVNGKYGIPGAVGVDEFKRILTSALNEEESDASEGSVCGPDGCRRS